MNSTRNWLITTVILINFISRAHSQSVIIPKGIVLPKDSLVRERLIRSLNGFLAQADQPAIKNEYILKTELLATSALLDEMKGMRQNITLKDNDFYKCYLGNAVPLDDNNFILQLSYIGINENTPLLRGNYSIMARQINNNFYFYSPLKQNTAHWKSQKINNTTYYFKDTLYTSCADAFEKHLDLYNKKLNIPSSVADFYYCDNFTEVLQLVGVDYKYNYNGIKNNQLVSRENNTDLLVNGWTSNPQRFDPHDMWHDRLRIVLDKDVINRPVDEGCAYLYGGSWGYTWTEILSIFKTYINNNPNANWQSQYMDLKNFSEGSKPLKVAYVLNALIVQEIEKKKGFPAVLPLLSCGKKEDGDANYFAALEKITGVKKEGFNQYITKLIKAAYL
ncbi:hypothetical protein [Chitinophaga sp. Cy-1792]|uniref:hypothetical protein n=1 Tax=Chitinophaga sp. Cy-1792 TaxID=2608339 RepID=UPI001420C32A|nr:hypothetical protein [Chitinophaga sp. Cy-1792]NIG55728.1 hypothetical protein [Chitinophaga sp. Cy-1792]